MTLHEAKLRAEELREKNIRLTDAAAEETMIGATLYDHVHGNGTVTNTYGNIGYLQINLLLFLQFMNK